jgi:hypothetical protein
LEESTSGTIRPTSVVSEPLNSETHASGVSWPAIIAGAFVIAALWLILLALGAGIGLSATSPWSNGGISGAAVGRLGIIWLIIVQIIASAMGGYLAGRLRTMWTTIHTDEVYFRDTAHGFLAWSVGLVITAAFLASAAASLAGSAGHPARLTTASMGGATAPADWMAGSGSLDLNDYYVDLLFRTAHPEVNGKADQLHAEAAVILTHALSQKNLSPTDRTYLAALVAADTDLSATESDDRVAEVYVELQQATDNARKAAAHLSLWLFVAFLIGAFSASYAATIGGRQRDQVKLVNNLTRPKY